MRTITLEENVGQQKALLHGIQQCSLPIIVTMDDDLEQAPEDIPQLIAKLNEGFDFVYGMPTNHPRNPLRNLVCHFGRWILNQSFGTSGLGSPFRALRAELTQDLNLGYPLESQLYPQRNRRAFTRVGVEFHPSRKSRSGHTWSRQVQNFWNFARGIWQS